MWFRVTAPPLESAQPLDSEIKVSVCSGAYVSFANSVGSIQNTQRATFY